MLIWDLEDGDIIVVEGHAENGVTETDWSPDSNRIATGGADGTIRIWNSETGEQLLIIQGGGFIDWHPTGEMILGQCASLDSSHFAFACVWDTISGEELLRVEQGEAILSVGWNYNGSLIATGGLGDIIKVWDGHTGTHIITIDEYSESHITRLEWHPSQNLLATSSLHGPVIVWMIR